MRPRFRRAIVATSTIGLMLLLSLFGSIYVAAFYHRWQASRLLACIRQIYPGTTTEEQARAILRPMSKYENSYSNANEPLDRMVQYDFFNITQWEGHLLGDAYPLLSPYLPIPRWTLFETNITYRDGLVAEIHIVAMQEEHPGYPHPDAASVRIYSTRFEQGDQTLPVEFHGYQRYSRGTQGYDTNGKPVGPSCCEDEFITLDERASPQQRDQSLNFALHCLTSLIPCNTPAKLRPPL